MTHNPRLVGRVLPELQEAATFVVTPKPHPWDGPGAHLAGSLTASGRHARHSRVVMDPCVLACGSPLALQQEGRLAGRASLA